MSQYCHKSFPLRTPGVRRIACFRGPGGSFGSPMLRWLFCFMFCFNNSGFVLALYYADRLISDECRSRTVRSNCIGESMRDSEAPACVDHCQRTRHKRSDVRQRTVIVSCRWSGVILRFSCEFWGAVNRSCQCESTARPTSSPARRESTSHSLSANFGEKKPRSDPQRRTMARVSLYSEIILCSATEVAFGRHSIKRSCGGRLGNRRLSRLVTNLVTLTRIRETADSVAVWK